MKQLMMLTGMLAVVLMVVTPAVADIDQKNETPQVSQVNETETDNGAIELGGKVANKGDYADQCTPNTQFGNTVTPENSLGVLQDGGSNLDDIVWDGGGLVNVVQAGGSKMDDVRGDDSAPMTFKSTQEASCNRSVQQSSGAG